MSLPEHNFLKTVIEAFKNDVPKKEYGKLSKATIQCARRDLEQCLNAIPGANFDNVKILRSQLTIAEMGNWSRLKEGPIEEAVSEYEALLKAKANQERAASNLESNKKSETSTAKQTVTRDFGEQINENDNVPEPRLKHVDTAELLMMKREREDTGDPDNEEDVPMPKLKHVDTAELLRRSTEAGKKLYEGNASIADLSDVYRPTRIAEMFSQLYDNEWTDAFEQLIQMNVTERQAIQKLLQYLENAFKYCEKEVEQVKLQHEKSNQAVIEGLKNVTDEQINYLQQTIGDKVNKDNLNQIIRCYIDECVRLTYLMNVQNPPMKLHQVDKGTQFNSNIYKEYTRTGQTVEYLVWPALLLYEDGPVAAKGVVQLSVT